MHEGQHDAGRLTAEELATAARVPVERIREFERLGVLTGAGSYSSGDVSRVRLVEACAQAGLQPESLATAVREGQLSFAFLELQQYAWPAHIDVTFAALCGEYGIDVALARRLFENASLPAPDPDVSAREDDRPVLELIAAATIAGLDESTMT